MSDLQRYIQQRKLNDSVFAKDFDSGYESFKAEILRAMNLSQHIEWLENFPITFMIKQGWITKYKDKIEQLQEIFRFFAINAIEQWSDKWHSYQVAYRKSQKQDTSFYAISAWLRQGEIEAEQVECEPFNAQKFLAVLPEIRSLTSESPEIFIPCVQKLCASVGVAVIFTPAPTKTAISGATHWLHREKAIIQLSLRYKSNDHLWFTFFHEAGHIIKHGYGTIFVEDDTVQQDNLEILEIEANQFARDQLINPVDYQQFLLSFLVQKDYSSAHRENMITDFAKKIGIAPGIVVGRLQFDKKLHISHCNDLKVFYDWHSMGGAERKGDGKEMKLST